MRKLVIWAIEVRARRNAADHSDVRTCRTAIQFMRVKCLLVMTVREKFSPFNGEKWGPG
jgi:hypothetical protein